MDVRPAPVDLSPRRLAWSPGIVLLNLGSLAVILWCVPAIWTLLPGPQRDLTDFYQEWGSARSYWLGQPIYQDTAELVVRDFGPHLAGRKWLLGYNVHPPTAVVVAIPFGRLNYFSALHLWNFFGLLLALLSMIVVLVRVQLAWAILPAVAWLCWSPHVRSQLILGQLNFLLLALICGIWLAIQNNRWRQAGVWMGVAAAIKVFPALLAFPFLVNGSRKGLKGVALGFLGSIAVTVLVLGTSTFADYRLLVIPEAWEWRGAVTNASLPGLFAKLFDPGSRGGDYAPLVRLPGMARGLIAVTTLGFLAHWGWLCRRAETEDQQRQIFSLGIVLALLLSPICWEHYLILLFPAMITFGLAASLRRGRLVIWLLLVSLLNLPTFRWSQMALSQLQRPITSLDLLGPPTLPLLGLLGVYALGVWTFPQTPPSKPAQES